VTDGERTQVVVKAGKPAVLTARETNIR